MGRLLGVLIVASALSACGITDRVGKRVDDTWAGDMLFSSDEQVILTIDGGNQLNPDAAGTPLSVVTRIYQLTSLERFVSSDADTLQQHPEQALGNTLLDSRERVVLPGIGDIQRWPLNKQARYVAVAAFFRDESGGRWKMAFNADAFRKDGIFFSSSGGRILLDHNAITAERGQDVLELPNQQAVATLQPAQPQPTVAQQLQAKALDSAQQAAEQAADQSMKKSMNNLFDSALEGIHE
ncbi:MULTISPECIES: type VI secretion system lipoprotein TssJ [Pseudomonas]|uniref:type VI secretion system lipoprotein TssJ n=1 Tax=Pseudomonas TaxID=286 RepID=UPI00159656D6|nr:type VI secretion system lipoprotein TssJ [Pseudomonas faucium]